MLWSQNDQIPLAGGIASHVERKTRYLLAAKLPDKTVNTMTTESAKAFRQVRKLMRKTLTVDNGKEFSQLNSLSRKPACLFCRPLFGMAARMS
jgi:IS30 family transposase